MSELVCARDDAIKVFGADARTVGFHLQNLSGYQLQLGRLSDATSSISRAVPILEKHAKPGSMTMAATFNVQGMILLASRRAADALPAITSARDAAARIFGPSHTNTLIARANHALATALVGR